MYSLELGVKKKKVSKDKILSGSQQLSLNEKYVNKVILANSPYLEKGTVITKKYLNPFYIDQQQSILLPPIKSPYLEHRSKSSEPKDQGRSNPYTEMPSLLKNSYSPENKYKHVKSKYLSNYLGGSLFGSNSSTYTKTVYYFYDIAQFNNGELIRKMVANRSWWKDRKVFKTVQPPINFMWTIGIGGFNYDTLTESTTNDPGLHKCINRFQNGFEINDKDNLYRNLWHYYSDDHSKVQQVMPMTFSFRVNSLHFRRDLQQFCRFFLSVKKNVPLDEIKPISQEKDASGNPYDVYYTFKNEFPTGNETSSFENFKVDSLNKDPCLFNGKDLWMLKPSGLNRGRGLELFSTLEELNSFLDMFSKGYEVTEFANMEYNDQDDVSPAIKAMLNKEKKRTQPLVYKNTDYTLRINNFVIQKYIEKPLLFKNHKFDLRVLVLMSHERELFVFGDCYVRLSSLPYDPDKKNYLIHLTNNAVQVRSNSYGSVVEGNIISIRAFEEHLIKIFKDTGEKKYDIQPGHFMRKIKEVVKITFDSTEAILHSKIRSFNFELFGYDFMIDEDMKLWLIEVNSVPSLGESNRYITRLLSRAIDDMLRLTIDKIFPPPSYAQDFLSHHQDLEPFPNNKNLWEKVCKYPL